MSTPRPPAASPVTAPPSVEPMKKNHAATANRLFRPRSPSGVMLESIDSPHGDHVARMAPMTAAAPPVQNTTLVIGPSPDTGSGLRPRFVLSATRRRRHG